MPKRNPSFVAFGRNVKTRREEKNLTQEALAERAELDRAYISDIERRAHLTDHQQRSPATGDGGGGECLCELRQGHVDNHQRSH